MQIADAQITRELMEDFRNTFLTSHGRRVFAFLLFACGYFSDTVDTQSENELRNFASKLIKILGAHKPVSTLWVTDAILNSVVNVPLPPLPEPVGFRVLCGEVTKS